VSDSGDGVTGAVLLHADTDTHGSPAATGHGDDEHEGEHEAPLGPIDWPAWALSLVGILLGSVVVLCLYLTAYPS
jgi:hypothetical protein